MFSSLPKSQVAARKYSKLSDLDQALLDMYMTAAFMRPDSHLKLLEAITTVSHRRTILIYVIEIEVAIISLAVSPVTGKVGIADFVPTNLNAVVDLRDRL